uniref:Anaphase-promoting complex subunit 4 n=1 Tax=Schistocephalus solidus TaxID=70667 RepID=A0A0X3P0C9_SCHSO
MAHSYITSLSTSPFLISGGLNVTLPLVEQLICRIRLTTFHPSMPWLYLQMRYLTTKRSFSCLKHFSIRIQSMLNAILGFLVFRLSVLLVYLDGCIRLFGCGVYEIARVDTNSFNRTFLQSFLAADLSSLYHLTTTTDKNSCLELQLHKLDTRPLSTLRRPLKHLSFHISALLHCKQILLWSLKQLKNAWENTLLELDTKLTAYARERLHASASWSLRNELLEIILFGHISSAFQKFLATEWTSNSIRRAGVTMLKAYESMKAITFQQLQFGLMRLIFEASEFLGFARNRYHYHLFNISETTILHLIRDAGATLQKAQELHLVVEHCSQYLRPFFKWLYGVAVTSTKIDSDKNAQKITSQERDLIINFVTEKLRPLIVDGELKSYQIELVEQVDFVGTLCSLSFLRSPICLFLTQRLFIPKVYP